MDQSVRQKSAVPWGTVVSALSALLYGVSPIDLLPDVIPILGLLDDIIAVPILLLIAYFIWKHRQKQNSQVINAQIVQTEPKIPNQYPS